MIKKSLGIVAMIVISGTSIHASAATAEDSTSDNEQKNLEERVRALEERDLNVDWSSGLPKFTSQSGKQIFQFFGRIQYDLSSTFGSNYSERNITGTELKRLFFGIGGQFSESVPYHLEFNFAGNDVSIMSAWVGFKHGLGKVGNGTLTAGNIFTDSGFSSGSSSKYLWFAERGAVAGATLVGGYFQLGLQELVLGEDWHYSLGLYKGPASKGRDKNSSDEVIISRAHWNPIHLSDKKLVHLGINGGYKNFHDDALYQKDNMIGTHYNSNLRVPSDAVLDPENLYGYGAEFLAFYGDFALGAEWGRKSIESKNHSTMDVSAYTVRAGYSITGEPFGYSTKTGTLAPVKVKNSVFHGGLVA